MKCYDFTPDYNNLVLAARNITPPRMPLYEHIICGEMIERLTGLNPMPLMESSDPTQQEKGFAHYWNFWRQMGYDTASYECCIGGILPGSGALGGHKKGIIQCREDFEAYPWDELCDRYFDAFESRFRALEKTRPQNMKAVGGVGNGVFECVQDLVGYMDLCYLRADDPELYADLFSKMGDVIVSIWQRFLCEYSDAYCVLRFGDDLGFNTMTLLPPDDIREHILPQYKRVVDLVHATGRPFLLHSCGNLFGVFDDIISMTGIDAKHSNEDNIAHFSVWVDRYGDKIGNFGGIDADVICRQSPEFIHDYVFDCLNKIHGHGGIAFSTGNSIPSYVPTDGYLAMIEAVRSWRGDKEKF